MTVFIMDSQSEQQLRDLAQWVMGHLGFTEPLGMCDVYVEDTGPRRQAINVLELL